MKNAKEMLEAMENAAGKIGYEAGTFAFYKVDRKLEAIAALAKRADTRDAMAEMIAIEAIAKEALEDLKKIMGAVDQAKDMLEEGMQDPEAEPDPDDE